MAKVIILALVQGLTEFLPISSSGHLALVNHFFSPTADGFFLAVFLHGGTLLSTLVFFQKDIFKLVRGLFKPETDGASRYYLSAIAIGTLPVIFFGLFLEKWAEKTFVSLPLLTITFLFTGLILALASLKKSESLSALNLPRAFGIGLAQLVAILPGISRSGTTISAGLMSGLSRPEAFRFSFLLSLPAVLAAFIIELYRGMKLGVAVPGAILAAGFCISFFSGLLALFSLRRIVISGRLIWFSFYLLALGIILNFLSVSQKI